MNENLRKRIGAYLIGPRLRQRNNPSANIKRENGKIVYVEDQQIQDLISEFAPAIQPTEMSTAYSEYLAALVACIDASRDPADKLTELHQSRQLDVIAEVVNSGQRVWDRIPGFAAFADDLKSRDIAKIREAMNEEVKQAGSPTLSIVKSPPAVTAFTPIGRFEYNPREIALSDTTIREATGKRFRSASALMDHLFAAESYIRHLENVGPAAAVDTSGLSYRVETRNARDVFGNGFIDPLGAQDLNMEVKVFTWSSPNPKVPAVDSGYCYTLDELTDILYCIEHKKNSVLVGPPGCGKTIATEQIAARLGRPFFRVPLDGQMRKREILGGFKQVVEDGHSVTRWFDGLVPQAMAWPSILTMDEIDRGDPDLQYVAHELYEGKGLTILEDEGRRIVPDPHFALIGTSNTKGRAEGMNIYSLGAEMSEATRDRFPFWIDWNYLPEGVETRQIERSVDGLAAGQAAKIIKIANGLRAALIEGKIRTATSYRQVLNCAQYAAFMAKTHRNPDKGLVLAIKKVFVARATDEGEVAAISEVAKAALGTIWETHTQGRRTP